MITTLFRRCSTWSIFARVYKINASETNVLVAIVCQIVLLHVSINYLTVNKYSQLRYRYGYAKTQLNAFKSMFLIRISNNLLIYKIDQINQISILSFYFFHFLPQSISARSFLPFFFRNIFPHYLFITCCFRRRSSAKVPNFPLWPKSKYIKRVHSVKIQRHTDSRANVITRHQTPSKTTLNIPKKKLNMRSQYHRGVFNTKL